MTWEEAERLMAFIREQQARINTTLARLDTRLNRPIEKPNCSTGKIDRNAERAMTLLATVKHAREMRKFDERLKALLNAVERYISEGRNGKA